MPAHHGPSVLVTGIHSAVGEYIGSEFMGHGWFVVGADSSHRTSHFARAHVHADLSSIQSYSHAVRRASILGNGLDCVVNADAVPVFGDQGEEFIRAAFVQALAEMRGSVVNVLAEARSEGLDRSFVLGRTAELAALNAGARVNTVAPNLVHSSSTYRGADPDEFLATLTANGPVVRPRPTLDDVAAAVFFIASQPLSGVTLGADDILPVLRR
jgi:NAD(P)-dependent dehydrogenase (short-subunit alcohol dehydrogenase family)